MNDSINAQSPMQQVLEFFPGAQRALFRRYHIGGCSSCAFLPGETVAQLCARNNNLDPDEVLRHIADSHLQDEELQISAAELSQLRQSGSVRLVDIRSREEFDAAKIEGAVLLSQPVMQEILSRWPREELMVLYDHGGRQSLDAAAYFLGHGFQKVRCLRGGIDAWSREIDPKIPRYRVELTA
jgi:rhodanese-related sulfurtransferase